MEKWESAMANIGGGSQSGRQLRAVLLCLLALTLGVCTPATFAGAALPPGNTDAKPQPALSPQVTKLLEDANKSFKGGDVNLALIQLKNAVRLAPQNSDLRAALGWTLLKSGQMVAAERELRQAWNDGAPADVVVPSILQAMIARNETHELLAEFTDPPEAAQDATSADILVARTVALQALAKPAEAKTAINRALRLRRDVPTILIAAKLAQQQGDLALARRLSEEATKLAPTNTEALIVANFMLLQAGENEKALAAVDDFVKRVPQSNLAKALRIEILLGLNQEAKAKEEIDALSKQYPNAAYPRFYRAVLMARAKDFKSAWKEMQILRPEFVQANSNVAMTVARTAALSGNVETGLSILTTFVSKHPEIVAARLELAGLKLAQKAPSSALETLAPLKTSTDPLVQAAFAQAYLQLRRYNDGIAALEIASAGAKTNSLLEKQLALSELQVGDINRAIEGLQDLIQRDPENHDIAIPLVVALVNAGKWDEALHVIDRLAKAPQMDPIPAFLRGQVLVARGDLAGASTAFGQALATDAKFIPALYYRSNLQIDRGNPEEANRDLQQILVLDPGNMPAYLKLAQLAAFREQEPQVIALLEKAIRVAPKDPAPRLALANFQISRAKYPEAQATVSGLLQVAPNNPEGLALKGQLEFSRGATAEAINTFRALAAANPQSSRVYITLAKAFSVAKDQLAAEDAAKRAIELDPDSQLTHSTLIEIQISGGKVENALASARAYASATPGPTSDLVLADTLLRAKRVNEAQAVLEKSFGSRPDYRVASRLSQIAMNSGDSKRAVSILANWLTKNPSDYSIRSQYASALLTAGDQAGARREFEVLLKQKPEDPIVLNNLGWILQKDDPARALSLVSLAMKIAPRSADIVDTLGWLKLQRRDNQGALPLLQRAHDLDPNGAAIAYHLALALDGTGKRTEAKTLLQSTLAKNPKFLGAENAKEVLARW
jgi:putative PEP-CTERM system TPR-repeat lipoprotein